MHAERLALAVLAALTLAGCDRDASHQIYTLYRSSVTNVPRVYVATFDAKEGNNFNRDSCLYTQELYDKQPDIKVRFWCEQGRFYK